jgi:hypothetical protein
MTSAKTGTTVVLVHAAWADGSSWNKVTRELQRKGFEVVAAQIPLTSFSDDVAVWKKVLFRQRGPIVLAGPLTRKAPFVGNISPNGVWRIRELNSQGRDRKKRKKSRRET